MTRWRFIQYLLIPMLYLCLLVPDINAATPTITLSFEGQIRDRVGQNNLARTADGQSDGTFTVTLTGGGPLTLTQLRLTNNVGGVWDTIGSSGFWTLGAATGLDAGLVNGSNDAVNFPMNIGDSLKLFAADYNNTEFLTGRAFTLTATFSDGTTATANATISPVQTFTLTVASSNPASGILITVSPNDNNAQGGGTTQFTRTYNNNTAVTLTAAATNFSSWTGCDTSSGTTCNVTINANKTVTAAYTGTVRTLTVASLNPNSGVSLTVSPNDLNNQGNGSTQLTRIYNNNTPVTLTAPSTVGANNFSSWTGCDTSSGTTCNVTMSANKTVTAAYVFSGPTITLGFDGQIRDRVRQSNLGRTPDGQSDGTFTVMLTGGGQRTLTQLRLSNNVGGAWDTIGSSGFWTLGAATGLDAGLVNGSDDAVNFPMNIGDSLKLFAADYNNTEFLTGRAFTLTATFSDGTTATANATISPVQTFTLTVASSNPASGASITVSPNDNNAQGSGTTQFTRTYNINTAVTLTAPANNFSSWTGCDTSSGTTCNVTMNANKTVTAAYTGTVRTLTVASLNPNSGVSLTVSPNDLNNQGNGSTQLTRIYNNNTPVTLTAPSTVGANNFSSWTGCDTSSGTTCNVTMSANKTVTAAYVFSGPTITLGFDGQIRDRVRQSNLGRTPDGQSDGTFMVTYTGGASRTLTQLRLTNDVGGVWDTIGSTGFWTLGTAARLDTALLNGTDDSVNFAVNPGDSFQIFAANYNNTQFLLGRVFTLTATFSDASTATATVTIAPVQTSTLTVASSNPSSGTLITVSPNDNNAQGSGTTQFTRTYNINTAVTLTAPSNAIGGSTFSSWTGCDTSSGVTCTVTVSANKTVTAVYTGPSRTLTVASLNPNSGVSLTVSPNDLNTQGNGSTQFTRIYADSTVVTLTAPANNFSSWTGCDTSTTTTCNVTMSANKTVTAVYTANILTVASLNPSSAVPVTVTPNDLNTQGNGSTQFTRAYNNTAVTLTAPATVGTNAFSSWTGCDTSSGTTCNVTMSANKTVTAVYTGNAHTLTVASLNPSSGVSLTVSPNDLNTQGNGASQFTRIYNNNTAVTLTAPATVGANNFSSWTGCDTSSGTTCNVTMNADKTVTATYVPSTPIAITTNSLPTSMVSVPYSATLSASGGTGTYTWSLASGTLLPRGLSLSANGTISGVPIEIGTSKILIQVSDSQQATTTASFMITILSSPSDVCCNGFTKAFGGYWSFDDGTPFDDSGFRSNGTPIGNPTVLPVGKFGQALNFDGTSQYIAFGNVLDMGTGGMSVFAWVKTTQITGPGGSNILISKLSSDGGYQLHQNFFGGLSFVFANSSTSIRVDSTTPINDGNWHLVGAVFTRSASGVIYVDGVRAANGSADISSMNGNFVGNTVSLTFGLGQQTNQGLFWKGAIDEVRILTRRALSDQDVADMYLPHPSIVSTVLPDGTNNVAYTQALKGSGGTLPYTWSLASGSSLPPGLSLSQTGTISGTPTAAGVYSFTIILDDPSNAPPATQVVSLTIRPNAPTTLLSEDFSSGAVSGAVPSTWTRVDEPNTTQGPSEWYVSSGGELIQESQIQGGFALDEDGVFPLDPAKPGTYLYYNGNTSTWQDYEFSVRIMAESVQAIGVMFRYIDGNNYYRFSMDYRRHYRMLVKVLNGQATILPQTNGSQAIDSVPFELGQSYNLRVSVSGSTIQVFLDNNPIPIFHVSDNSFTHGTVALYCWGDINCHYDDVLVTH